MISGAMAALVDVNVLIALLHQGHPHNASALTWLDGKQESATIAICRIAQMGALRIMTSRSVLRENAVTPREFWRGWDRMTSDDRFTFVAEPLSFEPVWREMTGGIPPGSIADTDVYLAAFARAGGHVLVTFDRGFGRFRGLDSEILAA